MEWMALPHRVEGGSSLVFMRPACRVKVAARYPLEIVRLPARYRDVSPRGHGTHSREWPTGI